MPHEVNLLIACLLVASDNTDAALGWCIGTLFYLIISTRSNLR